MQSAHFSFLQRLVPSLPPLLRLTPNEATLFQAVTLRTLQWNKCYETIRSKHLIEGLPAAMLAPMFRNRHRICEARNSLRFKGHLLCKQVDGRFVYALNLPKLVALYIQSLGTGITASLLEKLSELYSAVEKEFVEDAFLQSLANDTEELMKLKDVENQVKENTAKINKERAEKAEQRSAQGTLKPSALLVWFALRVSEHPEGLRHYVGAQGKTLSQAKNWIRECNTAGEDPLKLLEPVIEFWPDFASVLRNKWGEVAPLPTKTISFENFYIRRSDILAWIRDEQAGVHGDKNETRYIVTEIDLGAR